MMEEKHELRVEGDYKEKGQYLCKFWELIKKQVLIKIARDFYLWIEPPSGNRTRALFHRAAWDEANAVPDVRVATSQIKIMSCITLIFYSDAEKGIHNNLLVIQTSIAISYSGWIISLQIITMPSIWLQYHQ